MAMKLLAADYDGTLKLGEEVTSRDIEAIRKWRQKGNLFVIDTGRSMQSILGEVQKYDIPVDYFITNNGGMVFDAKQHELFSSYIDPLMSLDIMYLAKEIGNVVSYVSNDGYYRHRVIVDETLGEKRYPGLKPDLSEEELMASEKHAQFVISMATKKEALQLAEKINYYFSYMVVAYANKYVVDIVPKGISKATGLDYLCEQIQVSKEDVYTIGDADNDIPLMEYGIHGACISNAPKDVRRHAGQLYKDVAEMIEKNID